MTDRLINYYESRARGGASMLVTEPMAMLPWHTLPTRPMAWSDVNERAFSEWTDRVRAAGGLMLGQIQDNGRGVRSGTRNDTAIGASSLPDCLSGTVPAALTIGEIEALIEAFALSTARLARCGFAGVEISAGHGHLFHQFLSSQSNIRSDRYGSTREGRVRLLVELIAALRGECGNDFIIGVKLPADDGLKQGIDLIEAVAITQLIAATESVNYFTWCWGSHGPTLHWHLPDLHGPRMPYLEQIAVLRSAAPGILAGALGLITDPNEGERIVSDGLADLVMLARPLVTDAAWGKKAREGRERDIRYCVGCNTCWHAITSQRGLLCDNNPRLGTRDEDAWQPSMTTSPQRIVVVGAGVAGMEAAWVAAARGHQVTLLGLGAEAGGKTRLHAALPGGENLSSIYDYQRLQAEKAGVNLRLGSRASSDDILEMNPARVVIATGSTPRWPLFLPSAFEEDDVFPDLRMAVKMLLRYRERQPGTAVIWDDDGTAFTYDATMLIAERFTRTVLLTPRERIASELSIVARQIAYEQLGKRRVEIVPFAQPRASSAWEAGELKVRSSYDGSERVIDDVALFTYSTPRMPNDELVAPLRAAGISVKIIGDARAPRGVLAATSEGHRAGVDA